MRYTLASFILLLAAGTTASATAADHVGISYRELAEAHRSAGDAQLALTYYARALTADPDNALTYQSRGFFYLTLKKPELALADFSRQISIRPDDPAGYLNRGILLSTLGRDGAADIDFARACRLGANDGCIMGKSVDGGAAK